MIRIGKPEYIENEQGGRIQALIKQNDKEYLLYFQAERRWKDYLVFDRCDTFVACLISHAMMTRQDIHCEAPITDELLFKLLNQQIPVCAKFISKYHVVDIIADTIPAIQNTTVNGVGVGISNGVDSLYSVFRHFQHRSELANYDITHLAYFDLGASGDFGGSEEEELSKARYQACLKFAEEMNLPIVRLESNINELFSDEYYLFVVSFRILGAALALQKLFQVYYYSTSCSLEQFYFHPNDPEHYDLLNVQTFSNKRIKFYSYPLEVDRTEKLMYLSEWALSKKYLQVCQTSSTNCSRCEKCIRTMCELDLIGKLKEYEEVFDLDFYYKNKNKIWGWAFSQVTSGGHPGFYHLLKKDVKASGFSINGKVYIWEMFYRTRRILAKMKKIKKWYREVYYDKKHGIPSEGQYKDLYIRL